MKNHFSILLFAIGTIISLIAHAESGREDIIYEELLYNNVFAAQDGMLSDTLSTLSPNRQVTENLLKLIDPRVNEAYEKDYSFVSRLKSAPYVVRVLSDYQDEATGKWITFSGMGTLVSTANYTAVLTASHVSQGQNVRVLSEDGKTFLLKPGARLANVDEDVEILQLEIKQPSDLAWNAFSKIFETKPIDARKKWSYNVRVYDYAGFDLNSSQYVSFLTKDVPNLKFAHGGIHIPSIYQLHQRPFPHGSRKDLAAYVWDHYDRLTKPLSGKGYMSASSMPPGLSGAPVILDRPSADLVQKGLYNLRLDGLVLSQHRYRMISYYADADMIADLVKRFDAGQRTRTSPTRWRVKSGFTFRDFGNGVLETAFTKKNSANFLVRQSGNATSMDSGNGISMDSGNGISMDSGNGISMDSGDSKSANSGLVILGHQVGPNQAIAGRLLKKGPIVLPAIAYPHIEADAKKMGFTLGEPLTQTSDLYPLAVYKSRFVNDREPLNMYIQCFYELDEKGLSVTLYQTEVQRSQSANALKLGYAPIADIKISRNEMAKGLGKMKLIYGKDVRVNVLGFFLSDLNAAEEIYGFENVIGPSIIVEDDQASGQYSCYKTVEHRVHVLNSLVQTFIKRANQNTHTFINSK